MNSSLWRIETEYAWQEAEYLFHKILLQGQALDQYAKKSVKVLVVGNPANTNALICAKYAPSIPRENFSAMTRLDQNRAQVKREREMYLCIYILKVYNHDINDGNKWFIGRGQELKVYKWGNNYTADSFISLGSSYIILISQLDYACSVLTSCLCIFRIVWFALHKHLGLMFLVLFYSYTYTFISHFNVMKNSSTGSDCQQTRNPCIRCEECHHLGQPFIHAVPWPPSCHCSS